MSVLKIQYTHGITDALLAKYAVGETSAEENQMVKSWLDLGEANRNYMEGLLRIVELSHPADVAGTDEETAWQSFSKKIMHPGNNQGIINPLNKWMTAAAAVLLVAVSFFILEKNNKPAKKYLLGVHKIYGDGFRADTLPDGTWIMLDVNSTLSYTIPFDSSGRLVKLSGGGFFSVAHDSVRPFTLEVNDLQIRDIGTCFEIRSDSAKTSITVQSGTIEVSGKNASVRLTRGEMILVQRSDSALKKEIPIITVPVPVQKKIKQNESSPLSLTDDVVLQKQIVKNILADIKESRLADSVQWFALTTDNFIINGEKQPATIQKTFSERFHIKLDQGFFYGPVELTGKGFFITEKELKREP